VTALAWSIVAPIRAVAFAGRLAPGTIVYSAGKGHGWHRWQAPGWAVRGGRLVGDGRSLVNLRDQYGIRVPYRPGAHGLSRYELQVHLHQARAYDDGLGFGIDVQRVGNQGDAFDVRADPGRYLSLLQLPSGNPLAGQDADGIVVETPSIFSVLVFGHDLVAERRSDRPPFQVVGSDEVAAAEPRSLSAGSMTLYVDARSRVIVAWVKVIAR